jgi:hypothetical protein
MASEMKVSDGLMEMVISTSGKSSSYLHLIRPHFRGLTWEIFQVFVYMIPELLIPVPFNPWNN